MLVSGGWDNNVFVYDMRYRGPVHAIYGPHICGDAIDFKTDGHTMLCGSYRGEDALEVFDLRMMKRSRVFAWEGTGAQALLPQEPQTDTDTMSEAPVTDTEAENNETEQEEHKVGETSSEATTAQTRVRRPDKPVIAPFIYTAMINKREDMVFAGGAGKNEMRIFDYESGNIIAMIGNLPKSVLCGALANNSS